MQSKAKMYVKDKVLDADQWRVEAQAIIDDVRQHVRGLQISNEPALRSSNRAIHLNLTTLEGLEFCVRLSPKGFSIIGNKHDCMTNADADNLQYFESIYGLLDSISPQYRNSFGNSLLDRLQQLSNSQT
ncbi:GSK3-beta interaction protein [Phymastichus coffea]|uniref:GSK3-beta interaction protein n=1 Tax=Phymastichus coffea TaxID=108790 RepID=UPI00273C2AEC|nr:GSK3-beta interaction protein [Phymastichus coffea]